MAHSFFSHMALFLSYSVNFDSFISEASHVGVICMVHDCNFKKCIVQQVSGRQLSGSGFLNVKTFRIFVV